MHKVFDCQGVEKVKKHRALKWSQSLIHQVFDSQMTGKEGEMTELVRRNPLFIRSSILRYITELTVLILTG